MSQTTRHMNGNETTDETLMARYGNGDAEFFQIANRLLVDDYRRAHRNHEVPLDDREPRTARRGSEDVVADQEHVAQLVRTLSAEERYVVLSAKVEGIGYPELAEHLGRSVYAVKKMAHRAILRLCGTPHPDAAGLHLAG